MKKLTTMALAFIAGAFLISAQAATPKDKKKKKVESGPTVLATPSDSLSYAAGMAMTNGLEDYLRHSLNVDTLYMDEFRRGFQETIGTEDNPKLNAYRAGAEIARTVEKRMLPDIGQQLKGSTIDFSEDAFKKGFTDALNKDQRIYSVQEAKKLFDRRMEAVNKERTEREAAQNKLAGEKFLEENAQKEGVKTTPSGLQYKVLTQGTGAVPAATDEVVVKYEGRLIDGTVFDSSYKRKEQTNKFRANGLIKGWTEALTMMPVGSKWELYIPQELAYGSRDMGKIKPYSALVFVVELVDIVKP